MTMTKEEMDSFVKVNMNGLNEDFNNNPNRFPFNLAEELSNVYSRCDIQKLYDAINELTPEYKTILILRYKYNCTYKRIEEILGYLSGSGVLSTHKIVRDLERYYDIFVDTDYNYEKEYNND